MILMPFEVDYRNKNAFSAKGALVEDFDEYCDYA